MKTKHVRVEHGLEYSRAQISHQNDHFSPLVNLIRSYYFFITKLSNLSHEFDVAPTLKARIPPANISRQHSILDHNLSRIEQCKHDTTELICTINSDVRKS